MVYFIRITQSDIFEVSSDSENALKVLLSFDYTEFNDDVDSDMSKDKTRVMSMILLMNMKTQSLGVLELPAYSGVYNKESRLVLPIDMVYRDNGFKDYASYVASVFKIPNLHYIHIEEDKISNFIDLLGGLKIFLIGEEYSFGTSASESLGDTFFDGEDTRNYINNIENDVLNEEITKSSKRKELIIAIIKQIQNQHVEYTTSQKMIGYVYKQVDTSLKKSELNNLFLSLVNFDLDKAYFQRISGELRQIDLQQQEGVDEKVTILFTSSEVGGVANILKTVEEKLAVDKRTNIDNKVTITILNGTNITGLASKARNLYEKEGFNVISIGNADNANIDVSTLIDRVGDKVKTNLVAKVIGVKSVITDITSVDEAGADITIILGKDFDGEKIQ